MSEKRRRQKENRAARLAAEAKAAQWARRRRLARNIVIVVVVVFGGAFLLTFLGGNDEPTAASTTTSTAAGTTTTSAGSTTTDGSTATTLATDGVATPTSYELFASQETACGAAAPPAPTTMTFDSPADQQIDASAVVTAVLITSCGEITLELDPASAPTAVNSFAFLASEGYWSGSPIHRIAELPGKIIQIGDPTGTGAGNPGYTFDDELPPDGTSYGPGVLAMANGGPNTNGGQFFLTIGETPLNNDFTIFGSFAIDQPAITDILAVPLGPVPGGAQSRPLQSIYIENVQVTVS